VFNFLFTELEKLESGVVSISGFENAFRRDIPLVEALRVINFNRENLAQFNLRQIWWMSRPFHSEAIRVMPDLNSWFSLRLFLTEDSPSDIVYVAGTKSQVLSAHNLPNSSCGKFIGRREELQQIHQALNEHKIISLSGMGGIGKTELALQYAWREWHNETYPGGICWLNALTSDSALQILNFASQYLKLTLPEEGTLRERVRYCWQNWPEGDALIIFDDVRDYQQIKPYLPPQQDRRFQVLITTRFNYLSSPVTTLHIENLSEEVALDLLRMYVGDERINAELEQAKTLCQDLGYLPLALDLVARLLRLRKNWKLTRIQEKLTDNDLDYLKSDLTRERSVKAAFDISWQ
jgi:hypothetical protein